MAYAILRTAKLKSFGEIGGSLSHNYRTRHTPNADPTRTPDNQHDIKSAHEALTKIKDRLPEKIRSNAVLCVEYLITASPDAGIWKDQTKEGEFFEKSINWLKNKHGSENVITTSIHRDETTPHLIAYVVPIGSQGKLNAREFLGGRAKLSKMQTDFHNEVKHLGLERGLEGSKAEHKTVKEFYSELQAPLPKSEKINIKIQRLDEDNQPKSAFYDTKHEHGVRVMQSVYQNVDLQVDEIKQHFENKLKEMQADFELNLRKERQKTEAQRKAHEKAIDALQKNISSINDLKEEFKEFLEYKRIFPKEFSEIKFQLKSKLAELHEQKEREQRQKEHEKRLAEQYQTQLAEKRKQQKEQEFKNMVLEARERRFQAEKQVYGTNIAQAASRPEKQAYTQLYNERVKLLKANPYDLINAVDQDTMFFFQVGQIFKARSRSEFKQAVDHAVDVFGSVINSFEFERIYDKKPIRELCAACDSILDQKLIDFGSQANLKDDAEQLRQRLDACLTTIEKQEVPVLAQQINSEWQRLEFERNMTAQKQPANREVIEPQPRPKNDFEP